MTGKRKKWAKKRIVLILCLIAALVIIILCYPLIYTGMLKAAVRSDDAGRVKELLALPGDVNYFFYSAIMEYSGDTPLDVACKTNNTEMMQLLLQNGAHPNKPDGFGQPLVYVL